MCTTRCHGTLADIGPAWTPFPEPLAGDLYSAIAVAGEDLGAVNPFDLLADGVPGAREDMGRRTLVVVGANSGDGRPGFIVLAGLVDPAHRRYGGGEAVQDHQLCAAPVAGEVAQEAAVGRLRLGRMLTGCSASMTWVSRGYTMAGPSHREMKRRNA